MWHWGCHFQPNLKITSTQYPENCQFKCIFSQFTSKKYIPNHWKLEIWTFYWITLKSLSQKVLKMLQEDISILELRAKSWIKLLAMSHIHSTPRDSPRKGDQQNQQKSAKSTKPAICKDCTHPRTTSQRSRHLFPAPRDMPAPLDFQGSTLCK